MFQSEAGPFAVFDAAAGAALPKARSGMPRRRLGAGSLLAVIAAMAAIGFLALTGGGSHIRPAGRLLAEIDRIAVNAGFPIGEIRLTGHRHTTDREIYAAMAPFSGGSLAGLDVDAARAAVQALPWVQSAAIERMLPDRLEITISERTPVAVWVRGERRTLVDRTGRELADVPADLAEALALVPLGGETAAEAVDGLLSILAHAGALRDEVVLAERVGGRRWTLHLKGGSRAHLPAENAGRALERLASLLAEGAGGPTNAVIDLRLPDRIGVVPAARLAGSAPRG